MRTAGESWVRVGMLPARSADHLTFIRVPCSLVAGLADLRAACGSRLGWPLRRGALVQHRARARRSSLLPEWSCHCLHCVELGF